MKSHKIAIIGGGNLGASIAEGIAKSGLISPDKITVTRRKLDKIAHLKDIEIKTSNNNRLAVDNADIIVLAVKPKQLKDVLYEIQPKLKPGKHILISVVTGVSLADMGSVVGENITIVRAMPNTAIAIQESMTCIATNNASIEQQAIVLSIFNSLGKAVVIDENLMAAATVLGACGIAYSLRFIRAASQGGIEIGFNAEIAQLIAAQTVKGAASLLLERGQHPEREIDKVTTPQGCTIAGLNEMEHQGFSSALIKGIGTSFSKIDKISEDF
ncbi:MAG: pyrroline-5-carboxylate reductase [Flammeovirgaceae bacterium]|nr:pyrroline-5-carboxylate reductase [Flammeovirgaceae bacterium]